MPGSPKFSKDLNGKANWNVMEVFDVCLELPSDGKSILVLSLTNFLLYTAYKIGMYTAPRILVVCSVSQKLSQNLDENSQFKPARSIWSLSGIYKRSKKPIWFSSSWRICWGWIYYRIASSIASWPPELSCNTTIVTHDWFCKVVTLTRNMLLKTMIVSNHLPPPCKDRKLNTSVNLSQIGMILRKQRAGHLAYVRKSDYMPGSRVQLWS